MQVKANLKNRRPKTKMTALSSVVMVKMFWQKKLQKSNLENAKDKMKVTDLINLNKIMNSFQFLKSGVSFKRARIEKVQKLFTTEP